MQLTPEEILIFLSNGKDPLDGQTLSAECVCLRPEIKQSLQIALAAVRLNRLKFLKSSGLPLSTGGPWLEEDIALLEELYLDGVGISKIAKCLGRSAGAIRARLSNAGLLRD